MKRVLVLVLLAVVGMSAPTLGQAPPIKVGLIMPASGPFTVNAQRITTGVRQFFETKGWQVAGRKIELVAEDDQGEPQTSLTKAQKLVERDRILHHYHREWERRPQSEPY